VLTEYDVSPGILRLSQVGGQRRGSWRECIALLGSLAVRCAGPNLKQDVHGGYALAISRRTVLVGTWRQSVADWSQTAYNVSLNLSGSAARSSSAASITDGGIKQKPVFG
jgi:hypothetical protein